LGAVFAAFVLFLSAAALAVAEVVFFFSTMT
jgi:hypothetical protein